MSLGVRSRLALCAGTFALVVSTRAAHAASIIEPPKVVKSEAPAIPPPPEEITVVLELTISADGGVTDVSVASDPRPLYDEEAMRVVRASSFAPATRDGVAVAARIRFSVVFAAAPKEPTVAKPPPPKELARDAPPPTVEQATFGARAVTDAPPREPTVRSMNATELRMLGTRGDPLRAVELLPGMARTTFGNPLPIIRGSAPTESQVFLEGMPVPLLYHFGGITSFVPARFLDRVDYYPGNFSARYGRVLGGVIDVRLRDPKLDGPHGGLDLNLIDASGFVEVPIVGRAKEPAAEGPDKPRLSAAVGFRRSYIDIFYRALVPREVMTIEAAPVYYDYQGIVAARFSRNHTLRAIVIGSQDRFEAVLNEPSDQDPMASGQLDLRTAFHRGQVVLKSTWSRKLMQETQLAIGIEQYRTNVGSIVRQDIEALGLRGRAEWVYRPIPELRLAFGVDHATTYWTGGYDGVRFNLEGTSTTGPSSTPRVPRIESSLWVHTPALYAEAALLLGQRVTIMPSIRADYSDQVGALTIDPRLAVRANVTSTTTLKAGVGKFTQHPLVYQALPMIGNPSIEPGWATHASIGVEQTIGDVVRLSAEGFYKTLHQLPINTRGFAAPYFDNAGRGSIVGLELEARVLPRSRVYGLVTYTLSRSERSREDEPSRLFQNDQTHIASIAAVARIGAGWEAGLTFRLTSANPRTPVESAFYDTGVDQYTARSGAPFSERGPLYHRLDLHLEKTWTFTSWKLMTYLDIQNVYNSPNREYVSYNYDYTKQQGAASFPPFLPSVGIRGEL